MADGYCPLGINTGIVELSGPINTTTLQDILVDEPVLTLSFAPRTTPPTLVGNRIDEGPDNTIVYKGIRYTLTGGVQICKPLHKGYNISGGTSQAEVILCFSNAQISGSYPTGILCSFPIYVTHNQPMHNMYLEQLIASAPASTPASAPAPPVASLQTLFFENANDKSQYSFSYQTCIDTYFTDSATNISSAKNFNLLVFVYTAGILMPSKSFQTLVSQINTQQSLPTFNLPPALRGGFPTVLQYKFNDDGQKETIMSSPEGMLYTTQISTASSDFTSRYEFYPPPKLSSAFSQEQCPYYKTSQYKCVPFNRLQDLSGEYVIPEGTQLSRILSQQQSIQSGAINWKAPSNSVITTAQIETILGATGGVIGAVVIGLIIGHFVVKLSED